MADLVIVGDCNPDVMVLTGNVTPAFGQQEQLVPAISLVVGGSAAITAVAAARLGARVELVAAIGDDAAGQFMLAELRRAGVGTGHVIVRDDLPTGMSVALSRDGDRAILTAPGGIATLTVDDIPGELIASARHVHVSSYFLMEERLAPGLSAVFANARAAGVVTSLDTNWDPSGRWGGTRLREVLAQTDLLLPNEAEALRIAGAATLDQAVATLTGGGASVAVKRGGDGAILVTDGVRYEAIPPAQRVVDTTGAGDCFNAGLITALLAGRGPSDALALACASGAGSTRAIGGTAGCPDLPAALALAREVAVHPALCLASKVSDRREDVPQITPPAPRARDDAARRLAALATPPGALGRLGELGVWLCACQGQVPPAPVEDVRLVIFAGDHGVAGHGVSAFPPVITGAMVRTFLAGKAGVSALAAAHGVTVRVLDIGVDDDFADLDVTTRTALTARKIRRGSGAIHLEDALTADQTAAALAAGAAVAREEIAAGAQLLISGDMGIGNTTPAAAMVAAGLGLPAAEVTGRGTGVTDDVLAHKQDVIDAALARAGTRAQDPVETLTALGSADLAASTGYLLAAAQGGVPVLLDGLMSVACALTADRIAPGAAAWYAAGHRSTEPAQSLALAKLGLEPLLDLGLRLGEGSGAVAAVPVVRSAAALLRDVALLADLAG